MESETIEKIERELVGHLSYMGDFSTLSVPHLKEAVHNIAVSIYEKVPEIILGPNLCKGNHKWVDPNSAMVSAGNFLCIECGLIGKEIPKNLLDRSQLFIAKSELENFLITRNIGHIDNAKAALAKLQV